MYTYTCQPINNERENVLLGLLVIFCGPFSTAVVASPLHPHVMYIGKLAAAWIPGTAGKPATAGTLAMAGKPATAGTL
jgi:hypothetical protein